MGENVTTEIRGRVLEVTLDRPPVNVLNIAMMRELRAVLVSVPPEVRVVVLRASGKHFSAGVDVGEHLPESIDAMMRSFHEMLLAMHTIEPPTVALVHGRCYGGGMELAMAADLVYASATAKFAQPEIKLGVFPPYGAAVYGAICGSRRAADILFTGREMDAEEALAAGLVSAVFPEEGFTSMCEERVGTLAGYSRVALTMLKRALLQAEDIDGRLTRAEGIYMKMMGCEDPAEGLRSFLEKRTPVWKDR